MRPDVPLQRELARDDLLDRNLLVPAVAAVPLVATRLRDLFRAAQGASCLSRGLAGHRNPSPAARPARTSVRRTVSPCARRRTAALRSGCTLSRFSATRA